MRILYQVMRLDFSLVNGGIDNVEKNFDTYCGNRMVEFAQKYEEYYYKGFADDIKKERIYGRYIKKINGFLSPFIFFFNLSYLVNTAS